VGNAKYPILIGQAQAIQREEDPRKALGPLDMLEKIAREAAEDAGSGDALLSAIDTVGIVDVAGWNPRNGPRLLAERLGIEASCELQTRVGGEMALTLVNEVAERILAGKTRVALIVGTNNLRTAIQARKEGVALDWDKGGEGEPISLGSTQPGCSTRETAHRLLLPAQVYPLIETALRARRGRSPGDHMQKVGELMTGFTQVAAQNPYAWFPFERSAEELITVTDENRMISYPYPKFLNAVLNTDQAAGILLASKEAAEELGIARDRQIYWWGGANTAERAWFVSERPEIGESPSMRECARRSFENAGVEMKDIDHIDFYSCFPVAVELGCEAYGIEEDDPRGLTLTGGLPYAGGPGNNYPMHALATLVERLRAHPGDKGLVTGNGWYVTKHSASVWSSQPKPGAPPTSRWPEGPEVGPPPVEIADEADGIGVVESYAVDYGREGSPARGVVLGRLEEGGQRFIANLPDDVSTLEAFVAADSVGRKGRVSHREGSNVFEPR